MTVLAGIPYPEYRDSAIEWIGEIPTHWTGGRYKFCTSRVLVGIAEAATHAYADNDVPIIRSKNIQSGGINQDGLLFIKPEFAAQNHSKYLYANDVVTVRTGYPGVSAVVPDDLDKSQCFTNLVATPKSAFHPAFLCAFLNSHAGMKYFELLGWGSAQKNISVPILQNFPIVYPDRVEQSQILAFLDYETARIDALIEKQQQLIALLQEKRQAVISHAVTKGLNPDAPMRDSGVEWLGKVPAHWGRAPLKRVILLQRGHDLPTDQRREGAYPVMSSAGPIGTHDEFKCAGPGIVTGRYGTIGEFYLQECDFWPLNTALYSIDLCGNDVRFLLYMLRNLKHLFVLNSLKAAVPGVDRNDVHGEVVVAPSDLTEQRKIADYLDQAMVRFDELIRRAEDAVTLLSERRTALISAAVTGKIDVRNWTPPTADVATEVA